MIEETIIEAPKVDFFIKLASESDMPTAFADFYRQDYVTVVDEETGESTQTPEGEPYLVTHTHDYAIDVVGVIYEPTGNMLTDAEGFEYPETAPIDGWHVNVRVLNDVDFFKSIHDAYGVLPNSPSQIFSE